MNSVAVDALYSGAERREVSSALKQRERWQSAIGVGEVAMMSAMTPPKKELLPLARIVVPSSSTVASDPVAASSKNSEGAGIPTMFTGELGS